MRPASDRNLASPRPLRKPNTARGWLLLLYAMWTAVGAILLLVDWMPPWLQWSNPVFLYLAGLVGASCFLYAYGVTRGLLVSAVVFLGSMAAEGFGVHTGLLFGSYVYTDWLGPQAFGVPLAIGSAWIMVIATGHFALLRIVGWLRVLGAPLLAVALDLLLDPVAASVQGYWLWPGGGDYYGVPWQNFAGWYATAFALHLAITPLLQKTRGAAFEREARRTARFLLLTIVLLFALLALQNGLYLPPLLCLLPWGLAEWYHQMLERRQAHAHSHSQAVV